MKYDLHIHSKFSPCSNMEPKEIIRQAISKGLDGIAITDHNTIRGAVVAKQLNKTRLDIIIGAEIKTEFCELIVLGVKEEIKQRSYFDVIREVKRQKGIVGIAHPFDITRSRFHKFLDVPKLLQDIDFIEGFNSRTICDVIDPVNFAKKNNKPIIASSDAHFPFEVGTYSTIFTGRFIEAFPKVKGHEFSKRFFLKGHIYSCCELFKRRFNL